MKKKTHSDIQEEDLHAYVDGQLSKDRQMEVEEYLRENPEQAKVVQSWKSQNEALQSLYQPVPSADDLNLIRRTAKMTRPARFSAFQLAASFLILITGGILGSFLTLNLNIQHDTAQYVQSLDEASRTGFAVYASEVRHPVEVGADEEEHLVSWLGKRLGTKFVAPELKQYGFDLIGGRLVPFAGKPGAMLMYENSSGERLTVMIGQQQSNEKTGFRFAKAEDIRTFYWMDGELGYALSGAIDRPLLQALAHEIYRQI